MRSIRAGTEPVLSTIVSQVLNMVGVGGMLINE